MRDSDYCMHPLLTRPITMTVRRYGMGGGTAGVTTAEIIYGMMFWPEFDTAAESAPETNPAAAWGLNVIDEWQG